MQPDPPVKCSSPEASIYSRLAVLPCRATSLRNLTALVKFTSKELPTPGSMWARLQHRLNRFQLLGASEKATKVASKVPQRPIGILKLILHGLELEESDNPFVIIK